MVASNGSSSSPLSPKAALREVLRDLSLPSGLLSSALQRYESSDSWLWLVDNSSFMKVRDAHNVGPRGMDGSIHRVDDVSRWQELREAVATHAKVASRCWMPTKYRLVNDLTEGSSNSFRLCWGSPEQLPDEMDAIKSVMRNDTLDSRECRLTSRVGSLIKNISNASESLKAQGKIVTVVICTQGVPTNSRGQSSKDIRREFQDEMKILAKLPVRIVVRLATDDEGVKEMYDNIKGIDVLDDWWGEAMEVYLHNPWLTYSLGLHRLREAGLGPEILNVLDDRPLTLDEIHQLCELLFLGEDGTVTIPLPPYQPTSSHQLRRSSWISNWIPFITSMRALVDKEKLQWNPLKKRMTPWIDLKKLESNLREQMGVTRDMPGRSHSDCGYHGCEEDEDDPQRFSSGSRSESFNPGGTRQSFNPGNPGPTRQSFNPGNPGGARQRVNRDSWDHTRRQGFPDEAPPSRAPGQANGDRRRDAYADFNGQGTRRGASGNKQGSHSYHGQGAPPQAGPSSNPKWEKAKTMKSMGELTLIDMKQMWSHRPRDYKTPYPLGHLLATVPNTFPPRNAKVEPHEYFQKWKRFDREAFADVSRDELKEILKRALRKVKFFLHPDKLPKDLTKNQTFLFKALWDVITEREAATLN